jgi:phosphotransferase system HPr-like phosphotransfer protein
VAEAGSEIEVMIDGIDEKEAMKAIRELIESRFNEE